MNGTHGLVAEFEMDIVSVGNTDSSNFGSKRDPKEANYHKATDLIKTGQHRRARQAILSTGCSDPTLPHIQEQMGAKFPKRKKPISTPNHEHFHAPHAKVDRSIFRETLKKLKPKTSPSLGCLRNEHLTALLYTDRSQAPPSTLNAFDKLHQLCNEIVVGSLPWYFYIAWTATSLSAVNKIDPASLAEGDIMDCRPVAMGNTLRKAVTHALFDHFLQDIIAETKPTQFGCREKACGS